MKHKFKPGNIIKDYNGEDILLIIKVDLSEGRYNFNILFDPSAQWLSHTETHSIDFIDSTFEICKEYNTPLYKAIYGTN